MADLAAGRHAEAAARLAQVDEALAGSTDLDDVRARVLSLRAQAAIELGLADPARAHARDAMRLLKAAGDQAGLDEVRALDARIAAVQDQARREGMARSRAEGLASTTAEQILARSDDPLVRADALIRHAGALRLVGQLDQAAHSAALAVTEADRAGTVRERVLARLALVEAAPDQAQRPVLEALEIADQASETTLIGLVAQAARLAGVQLPVHHGPHTPPERG